MTRLLLVCHQGVGEALRSTVQVIIDHPVPVSVTPVRYGDNPDEAGKYVELELNRLAGDGPVLVLTDLPGATPHNVAMAVVAKYQDHIPVVTGLNLPMLLRALNHLDLAPAELALRVEHGGRNAIFSRAEE